MLGHWDVQEGSEFIIVDLWDYNQFLCFYKAWLLSYWISGVRSGDDNMALAIIVDHVLFVHQIFCIIQPFFLPNPAVRSTQAWDLDEGLKVEVNLGRFITYPWQFDTLAKGPSSNNNDWSSCVWASLQLESWGRVHLAPSVTWDSEDEGWLYKGFG